MNLLGENYQTLPATGLKEEFFTCTKTKNHVCWLGRHLGKVCNKVFKWKNSKYFPIYGHVQHKWLAIFPTKPIKRAGLKKMTPFASQWCPGVLRVCYFQGVWVSTDVDVHCSSLKQIYSKFCGKLGLFLRYKFPSQKLYVLWIHKVHVKHLNCTCTLYLKSLKKYFL